MSELHHTPVTVTLPDTHSEELNDQLLWLDARYYNLTTRAMAADTKERLDALVRVGKSFIRTMDDETLVAYAEENFGILDFDPVLRHGGRDVVGHRAERKKADRTIKSLRLRTGAQVIRSYKSLMDEKTNGAIIGPVTESLSLTPEEVEQAHAVVATIEAERQARQASRRRPRQELSPTKQPSEDAVALRAMITAREQARAEDRQFEEDSANLPQRHFPRNHQRQE